MSIFSRISDRFLYFLGSQRAAGRIARRTVSDELMRNWRRYAGRNDIRRPTVEQLMGFLRAQYGVEFPGEFRRSFERKSGAGTVNVDQLMPILANALLNEGLVEVEL